MFLDLVNFDCWRGFLTKPAVKRRRARSMVYLF
ncbi:MAG: hypothetical protein ACI94D_000176, partial [Neolewinella sp.]